MNRSMITAFATIAFLPPVLAQQGDAARGQRDFQACAPCHSLQPDRNMTGPSLADLWNRKAGGLPSFSRYSQALKSSGITWDDATLNEWLRDPQHLIPGNTMLFRGLKDAGRRGDLLAFLKAATQPGHAPPSAAQRGNQMGGMMGRLGSKLRR